MHPGTVLGVDWSGALRNEQRGLWVARWDGSVGAVTGVAPATRRSAVRTILETAASDSGLVVGLDFCFSMPAWWLADQGIGDARELWADSDRLEAWLEGCRPPFWGRPGRRRPELGGSPWRSTELAAPVRPRSVFQIGGAGAVGTASLRGMPALDALTRAGCSAWPFDAWATPAVVEVWPRLAMGRTVKSSAPARAEWLNSLGGLVRPAARRLAECSPDAFDAVAAAVDLAARGDARRDAPPDPAASLEGWIDGVGWPSRSGGPDAVADGPG